jgi:ABC-type transport system involved in multi-copper enzyme maturation permease subunit
MIRIRTVAVCVWRELLRRKDIYVVLILGSVMLLTLVSLNIFGLGGMVRYVTDVGLTLSWVFGWVLAIHVTARELPQEEARGTIFPLLSRPITRGELIVGKWLGTWSSVAAATLVFYLLVCLLTVGLGGHLDAVSALQAYALHAVALGILSATALAFSTRFNSDAAAALTFTLTGAAFLVLPRVPALLVHQKGFSGGAMLALYHVLPHLELFDMRKRVVHEFGALPSGTWIGIMIYGLVWTALILLLAYLAYRKKRFSRGALNG